MKKATCRRSEVVEHPVRSMCATLTSRNTLGA